MVERWKPVRDYEDLYQVSDSGRVRRIAPGHSTYAGRILRPCCGRRGYPLAGLSRNGHEKTRTVHILVAEAFLGPCPAGLQVNHKNGIKEDNRVTNLEYVTSSENLRHSYRVLGREPPALCGEANGYAKLTAAAVRAIRRLHAKSGLSQHKLAKRYDVSQTTIWRILRQKNWTHVA